MSNVYLSYVAMFVVIVLWGSSWPITRYVSTHELGPFPFTSAFIRISFAIPFLFVSVILIDKKIVFPKHLIKQIAILGLFQVALHNFFFLSGLRYTSGSDGVLVINAGIAVIAPILAHFVYDEERLDRIKTLGISISFIGVLLIFNSSPNVDVENRYLGNFLILGASVSWSIYTVFSKTILKEIPPLTYQFWSLVSGWIMLTILMVAEQSNQRSPPISFATMWRLAYLGIFAAAIAYSLYNVSIKHIGPTRTAVIINFAPLFGIFFSVVFAQEEFSLIYPIAFATIFSGIYLVNKNS
ncbi:MAG: DMT family transporter [Candidatus Heimdallarchaeota archaeon]|nr:DMT family transporter [Candidatus Heimdallarchaeota archaeon]